MISVLSCIEIERKGCTGAFMALVLLSSRAIVGAANRPPGACFSYILGGRQLHWGRALPGPRNSNTGVHARHRRQTDGFAMPLGQT